MSTLETQPAIRADQIVLATEVYLGDWSHSVQSAKRAVDAKATFFFAEDADMQPLTAHQTRAGQGKKTPGKRFRLYLVEADDEGDEAAVVDEPAPPDWGQYAKDLKLSGFFRTPDVWRVLGSDVEFRDWVTYQPSIVSGFFSETDDAGVQRNVACHVRRAGEAGTGRKPDYACVPMTDGEHRTQHNQGESALYAVFLRTRGLHPEGRGAQELAQGAADWFDTQRIKTVERWGWDTLKNILGVDSMKHADPDAVYGWAAGEGVERYLPGSYKHGAEA